MNKKILKGIVISLAFAAVCSLSLVVAGCQTKDKDPLQFPKDEFTVETKTVKTSAAEKEVTYLSYMHLPYVANPVDADYQSLNVSVPVKVDDVEIDATNAPILFAIGVGGYMSSRNVGGGGPGGGMGGMPQMEGSQPGPSGQQGGQQSGIPQIPVGQGGPPGGMGGPPGSNRNVSGNLDLALAAGYVVVSPGCRGRDNVTSDGTYYGKAPAAIVDLKAAVRYIRHNDAIMPGNANWIISTGGSAGGALSALLGASGNSPLYDAYLKEIGAADEDDNIYGSGCYCPITDLEHADGAYEWMYGTSPTRSGLVDQELSKQLKALNAEYQASLNLQGKNGFGTITADNYDEYLLQYYMIPSANKYLIELSDEKRKEYLENNQWITWSNNSATFAFADYVSHAGRMKGLPAFDDFDMTQAEPIEFGNETNNARHFTNFSLRQTSGNKNTEIDSDLQRVVNLMNPMYFIGEDNSGCAGHWWIRHGTCDNHTSQTVITNLAISLENWNKDVNCWLYWDGGHGADEDSEDFIAWIGNVTGFTKKAGAVK